MEATGSRDVECAAGPARTILSSEFAAPAFAGTARPLPKSSERAPLCGVRRLAAAIPAQNDNAGAEPHFQRCRVIAALHPQQSGSKLPHSTPMEATGNRDVECAAGPTRTILSSESAAPAFASTTRPLPRSSERAPLCGVRRLAAAIPAQNDNARMAHPESTTSRPRPVLWYR